MGLGDVGLEGQGDSQPLFLPDHRAFMKWDTERHLCRAEGRGRCRTEVGLQS